MIFKTAASALEGARSLVRQASAQVREALPSLDASEQVTLGYMLWDLGKQVSAALDPIKQSLREQASKEATKRPTTVTFSGHDDLACQVVFSRETIKVPASNMATLKDLLGDRFPALFRETISYKPAPNFQEALSALPEDVQRKVLQLVQVVESTPRVGFLKR